MREWCGGGGGVKCASKRACVCVCEEWGGGGACACVRENAFVCVFV